ncbi:PAS-domain containing protein, partial [Aliiglaciecola sp.]|nr:PAS-domain containing protein [Aliiglaciecola sp.]
PIGFAGHIIFAQQPISTDSYALALPLYAQNTSIALVSFIGGVAAAASMVVVATLAVGIMISNNLIMPLWVKLKLVNQHQPPLSPSGILLIRRLTIASVIGAAYLYHRDVSSGSPLVNSGIIAMALLAQTLPMILLSLYWPKANRTAATTGLLVGALCWSIWLLWPSIVSSYYFDPIPSDLELGQGFVLSLVANLVCFILVTLVFPSSRTNQSSSQSDSTNKPLSASIKLNRLLALTQNVLTKEQLSLISAEIVSTQEYASPKLIADIDSALAAKIGGASSRILISAIAEKDHMPLPELVEWMEEATQTFQFNHEILQSSVEHIQQGISVVDPDLKLIAWNQRYIELFDYPEGFIQAGLPMEELLKFNAQRGLFGDSPDIQAQIDKRIHYIRSGSHYKYVRRQTSGQMIELNGSPLPGGGFVTTYSDISEYIAIQNQLEQAKSSLEQRVATRTEELHLSNQALSVAKQQAEQANESKTKFLAAAGHDLMQPFNAASLFAELIKQKADNPELHQLSQSLNESLHNAEELLSLLLDMTKLESGVLKTHLQYFCVDDILRPLATEFAIFAEQKGLKFKYVPCSLIIHSDKTLLRRIIQNLLSNAVRYTQSGSILLGCKRKTKHLALCVADTGPGISKDDQTQIFKEFKQLNQPSNHEGLGLGLTIVEKITRLLEHPLDLTSIIDKGSVFRVSVPFTQSSTALPKSINTATTDDKPLAGKTVLVAENDEQTRVAVMQLLSSWGAMIEIVHGLDDITAALPEIDLMLLDYHLNDSISGIDIAKAVRRVKSPMIPGILNSSDRSEKVRSDALDGELLFLPKPLKSAAFKRMLRKIGLVSND